MPELPEVETVRRALHRRLRGRTIQRVVVRNSKVVAYGTTALSPLRKTAPTTVRSFVAGLSGLEVFGVGRSAKLLLIHLSGWWTLAVHLKLTGQLIVQGPRERAKAVPLFSGPGFEPLPLPHAHTHVTLEFSDGSKLHYNDLRRFGYLRLVRTMDLPQTPGFRDAGVEPFSQAFTTAWMAAVLQGLPRRAVKAVLLDPTRIAGIGNIYADESLFRARIRPTRPAGRITPREVGALCRAIRTVLTAAIRARGSSVGDFLDPSGRPGKFGLQHRVYGRAGKPCKRCGALLKRTVVAGRGTVYCPHCQK